MHIARIEKGPAHRAWRVPALLRYDAHVILCAKLMLVPFDPSLPEGAPAVQVLRCARPAMHHGHDPTESLNLEVFVDGRAQGAAFLWGCAS
jgi:hypothetical protein